MASAFLLPALPWHHPRGLPASRRAWPVAVTAAYLLMTGQAYVRGLEIENCTCFGVYLAQRLSGFVLVQDIYMIVYATWQQRRIRIW